MLLFLGRGNRNEWWLEEWLVVFGELFVIIIFYINNYKLLFSFKNKIDSFKLFFIFNNKVYLKIV